MQRPRPAHERLANLAGEWLGDKQLYPSPWDPKGADQYDSRMEVSPDRTSWHPFVTGRLARLR